MKATVFVRFVLTLITCGCVGAMPTAMCAGEKKRNNLVTDLIEVSSIATSG